ncbi:hypothetical protein GCM10010269_48040 [Streptomyces humidus]|uniref:Luciferase-like domain-containing protein n=1 Tax=Streptomyces humidus TaxID=52259 RepID=A0A918FYN5_9ACTN|nr:LLM class flavin-dependent oxidoreductase [Streptomyces humidus]GGS03520.1 hypothetical protein GCM10010269_48040 [Streptomyces humidus]
MPEYGYFLSCEEFGPADLVEQARMAEQAGFRALWISDRHHPWNDAQGQSPFVWSVIGALSEGGGGAKPVSGGTKVCYGADRDEAVRTVRRLWSNQLLPGEMGQILPTPSHFEQLEPLISEEMVGENTVCGDDVDEHVAALTAFADAGFDRVYVNQIGPDQRGFFDFYRTEVLPRLR